ncbi:MAG: hypothetical protein EAZ57_07125 [Cytophagales bacterium]|nr:MAG: hypothetical protein EAZ67_07935 [Cytophagales bacterium]TAF60473.1 MAG: hypothetical protein EAZ57_07125 [Cytophagales bacterium]
MKIYCIFLWAVFQSIAASAQVNCNWYKYQGDMKKYAACLVTYAAKNHYQFSKEYQSIFDSALCIDSSFAYAYRAKSTAYLKAGNFLEWKALMDKAVELEPAEYLDYRGWCRYQFFRDYEGAIADLERLKSLRKKLNLYSVNGNYHLEIALALCYKGIKNPQKGIEIIEEKLKDSTYTVGLYDYLHLGVMYLETGQLEKAIHSLTLQQKVDLAENRFYLARAYRLMGNAAAYKTNLQMAKELYNKSQVLFDPYCEPMDKVFYADILAEEKNGLKNKP